jgi:hypothetical protein
MPIEQQDESATAASPVAEPLLPSTLRRMNEEPIFTAALRPGIAYINRGDGATAEELHLRFDARLGENHRISLHAGRSASVSETRAEGTDIFVSRALQPGEDPADVLAYLKPVDPYEMNVQQEMWVGLGYAYSLKTPIRNVRVDVGGSVGMGEHSWRVGLETPVSLRVAENVLIEAAPSVSRVIPRDRSVEQFTIYTSSDGRLYQAESNRPGFTSLAFEMGLRVELP